MALRPEKIQGVSGKGHLIELEFGMLVFIWREENSVENQEKNPWKKTRTKNKLKTHTALGRN